MKRQPSAQIPARALSWFLIFGFLWAATAASATAFGQASGEPRAKPRGIAKPLASRPVELTLVGSYPVAGPKGAEPSGLCLADGLLLAISDKHDTTIFRIAVSTGESPAEMTPHLEFRPPPRPGARRLDFEAIAHRPEENAFYLASETASALLRVDAVSGKSQWIELNLPSPGQAGDAPFLRERNAGLEGIAFLPSPERLLLAVERQPRGLLAFAWPTAPGTCPRWSVMEDSAAALPEGRPPDFSDLAVVNGRLLAISRNAEMIISLAPLRGGATWRETGSWSYKNTVREPRFAFAHARFGMAEGLAIDDKMIWLILDNNRSWRTAAPGDRRPLLFQFARPSDL